MWCVTLALFIVGAFALAGCKTSSTTSAQNTGTTNPSNTTPNAIVLYPSSASVSVNQSIAFKAFLPSVSNGNFNWSVSGGSGNGSISGSGVYTAPASVPSPSSVTITVTSTSSSSLVGTATVNVAAAQGVQISPAAVAVAAGATQSFSATLNGSATSAQWEVNGNPGGDNIHGTIDASGNYTAPLTPPPNGTATITALSGNASGTASVAVFYSNASLNGPYAFSYTGDDGSGFLGVAGSFTAQGSTGAISGGVENEVSFASGASTSPSTFTGSFSVNPDGGATVKLSTGAVLQISLASNQLGRPVQQAPLIRFDSSGTGSGTINAQTPARFSASSFAGNYVFGVSGLDSHSTPIALAGRFFTDGISTIPANSAEEDINYGGTNTQSDVDTSLQGSFVMDPTYGTSNGRGTLTLTSTDSGILVNASTTFTFAFYMVDNTHLKLIETDTNFAMAGDVYSGANTAAIGSYTAATSLPSGKYAFALGGSVNNSSPYAVGGTMSVSSASITGVGDINSAGNVVSDATLSGGVATDVGFGRISIPFLYRGSSTFGTSNTTVNVVGYRGAYSTPTGQPVVVIEMIEVDDNQVASGLAFPQTSSPAFTGNYALDLSGISNVKSNPVKEDISGQIAAANLQFAGNVNINNFGNKTASPGVPLTTGTVIVNPDANGRGTFTLQTNVANDNTFSIAYYNADNAILLFDTDGNRIAIGAMYKQF